MAKGTNTDRVITSCNIFNWPISNTVYPMRFAGTWSRYSKKAIPQLTKAAINQGLLDRFFRCPYHAKVIKALLHESRQTVK